RYLLPREHSNQAVIAASATETSDALNRDLHDRTGVVRQPPSEGGFNSYVFPCARRLGQPNDISQVRERRATRIVDDGELPLEIVQQLDIRRESGFQPTKDTVHSSVIDV